MQVFEQSCGILRRRIKAERAVSNIRSVSVALLLERNDLSVACQLGQNVAEGGLDRIAAAVQQHQRRARRFGKGLLPLTGPRTRIERSSRYFPDGVSFQTAL